MTTATVRHGSTWLAGLWWGLQLLLWAGPAAAQAPDSVLSLMEVDQLPRSDFARTPAVAYDARGNFTVVWAAEVQSRTAIYLRRFDPIGRPLSDPRVVVGWSDTVLVANPQIAVIADSLLWLVWDQTTSRQQTEVVAQVLNFDLKPLRPLFPLHEQATSSTTRARVYGDVNGNVVALWVLESSPPHLMARFFDFDGVPQGDPFNVDLSDTTLSIGERPDLAVSASGIIAATWHAIEPNGDHIYLRLFVAPGAFLTGMVPVADRNVTYPSLAFVTPDQLVVQWFASESGALIRGQRFDFNGTSLSQPFVISAGDPQATPSVVVANEQGTFVSFWSARDPSDRQFSQVLSRSFLADEKPLSRTVVAARSPNNTELGLDVEAAISQAGNYVAVYNGNDGDVNSPFPRVGAVLTQATRPDLQLFNVIYAPARPTRADTLMVQFTVLNGGVAPAATSTALVQVLELDSARTVDVPPLAAGAFRSFDVSMGSLPAGDYTLRITLDHAQEIVELDEQNNVATLALTILEAPALSVSPAALEFEAVLAQSNPPAQTLTLQNTGSGTLTWTATVDQPWLSVTPAAGAITTQAPSIQVRVDVFALAAGAYDANIAINSNGGRATIPVHLVVMAPVPGLSLQPHRLEFAGTQSGSNPPPQTLSITNSGSGTLIWNLSTNQTWLRVFPSSGTTTGERDQIEVTVDLTGLTAGSYNGAIFAASNAGNDTVRIALTVSPMSPILEVSPRTLSFVATEGVANPPVQPVTVRNAGGGTLQWSVEEDYFWISINPRSGTTTSRVDTIRVTASITALTAGSYTGMFAVTSDVGRQEVRVNFLVNPRPVFPDLAVRTQYAGLERCFAQEYWYLAEFVVQNLGEGVAAASLAQLVIDNQVRQQTNVPALAPAESSPLVFFAEALTPGWHQIQVQVDVGSALAELTKTNNTLSLQEWVPRRGDANLDSLIDLRDLYHLVDFVLERAPAPDTRECWAANVAADTVLNLVDVVQLIDLMLGEEWPAPLRAPGALDLALAKSENGSTRVSWHTPTPLRAWQARWPLAGAWADQAVRTLRRHGYEVHWKIAANQLHLLVWNNSGQMLPDRDQALELPLVLSTAALPRAYGLGADGEPVQLEVHDTDASPTLPERFTLSPAFPNPVPRSGRGAITWRYELPVAAPLEMTVYNLLGQAVRQLSLGTLPAGRGELQWDGRDQHGVIVAGGIYFVEVRAGSLRRRERLVLP